MRALIAIILATVAITAEEAPKSAAEVVRTMMRGIQAGQGNTLLVVSIASAAANSMDSITDIAVLACQLETKDDRDKATALVRKQSEVLSANIKVFVSILQLELTSLDAANAKKCSAVIDYLDSYRINLEKMLAVTDHSQRTASPSPASSPPGTP